jgi:hypothetical protein
MIFRIFTAATIMYTTRLLKLKINELIINDMYFSTPYICPIPKLLLSENDTLSNTERETILQMIFTLQ